MKVYDWKTLLACVTIGVGGVTWGVMELIKAFDPLQVIWVASLGFATVKGIYVSITEEGYLEEQERVAAEKELRGKIYGRLGGIMEAVYAGLFLVPVFLLRLLPEQEEPLAWVALAGLGLWLLSKVLYLYYRRVEQGRMGNG